MAWESVIGLEVHVQLATKSKIFSGASTAFGAEPNQNACAIDLGFPGVLPVLNAEVVRMAVTFGLAIQAEIAECSVFARKNYFYPDLPKGYQISQYDKPIVGCGHLDITLPDGQEKRVGITRAHLEEDAGKSLHESFHKMSGLDFNRAGTPLLEIVSEPDLRTAIEAVAYLKTLHTLVQYLEICDGNLQEGSFRCDANVSIRPQGSTTLGTRTELKNINSFRFVERAINYEISRQITVIESGGRVIQETRLYDSQKNETRALRSKEEANDYRYFPDPDLLPVEVTALFKATVQKRLPELPEQKRERFQRDYGLSVYDAAQLVSSRAWASFYETVVAQKIDPKLAANWINGDLAGALNKVDLVIEQSPVSAEQLAGLLQRLMDNTISSKIAKTVFEAMWNGEGEADVIIEKKGLRQVVDESAIEKVIAEVLAAHPEEVAAYRGGKEKLFGYFVGLVMKASQGKANPQQLNTLLKQQLSG